jgi:hypothetical protein
MYKRGDLTILIVGVESTAKLIGANYPRQVGINEGAIGISGA